MGHIEDFNVYQQAILGDFTGGLKDLATEQPEVRATLIDAFATWVEEADLDGYRIDTIKHVESDFWPVFAGATRKRLAAENKKNFLMFGEAFDGDDQLVGSYTAPGALDSVFYFPQEFTVYAGVFESAGTPSQQGTDQIQTLWDMRTTDYGTDAPAGGASASRSYKVLVNFIDNHDVPRFLFASKGNVAALDNALTLLFTEDGIPDVYYGTEQGFDGGNDPANREVLWTAGFSTDGPIFTHIAKLARLRKAYTALRRGDTKVVWSTAHVGTEQDAGIFAFERAGGDAGSAYALTVLNTSSRQAKLHGQRRQRDADLRAFRHEAGGRARPAGFHVHRRQRGRAPAHRARAAGGRPGATRSGGPGDLSPVACGDGRRSKTRGPPRRDPPAPSDGRHLPLRGAHPGHVRRRVRALRSGGLGSACPRGSWSLSPSALAPGCPGSARDVAPSPP